MAQYSASNLEDIAFQFDGMAFVDERQSQMPTRTIKACLVSQAIGQTWREAARILRNTEICENTELIAALKELMGHVGYSTLSDEDLEHESIQGNGFAPILLRCRASLAKAEGRS